MVIAKQNREIAELRKLLDEHDAKLRDLQEKISKSQALPSTSVIGNYLFGPILLDKIRN